MVVIVESGANGGRKELHQPLHFLLGALGAGDSISARQSGKVLAKTVAGNEAVKIWWTMKGRVDAVPAAHIFAGSFHARELAKWFQQLVVVQTEIELMVGVELLAHRSFQKLDLVVIEDADRGRNGGGGRARNSRRRSECRKWFMS